jgi:threonine dehydratase
MNLTEKHDEIVQKIHSSTVYDVAKISDLDLLKNLSKQTGNKLLIKREDTQCVHSFKLRGAYNKISQLSENEKTAGIITASAGNHAQGVAYSCQKLGLKNSIVMPETTPLIKVNAVKSYGADVVLHGDSYDDAYNKAKEIAEKTKMTYIPPYDDAMVIAGQGTIAKEILDQLGHDFDYMFIPTGGGGLLAGMTTYLKKMAPNIKVIAVEPIDSACFHHAKQAGKRIILDQVGIFADGVAVKQIGELPFELCESLVDDTIQVSTDEICAGIKDIYDDCRAIAEPAGALSVAGMKKYSKQHNLQNKTLVGILCGANINFHRLRHISERAQIGEKEEALYAVEIPEKKGSFLNFCQALTGKSISEFNYRFQDSKRAFVFVGIELKNGESEGIDTKIHLENQGYKVTDLTDDDISKTHIRYMIGGKAASINDERLYRFEFPERPGALLRFLNNLGSKFNISLFHYRNHGAAYGRVLAGLVVPENELQLFEASLKELNYTYFDESDNTAYRLFL